MLLGDATGPFGEFVNQYFSGPKFSMNDVRSDRKIELTTRSAYATLIFLRSPTMVAGLVPTVTRFGKTAGEGSCLMSGIILRPVLRVPVCTNAICVQRTRMI